MEKIKQLLESDKGKDLLVVIIIILVGLASFELGRLSKNDTEGLKIDYKGQESNVLGTTQFNSDDSSDNLVEIPENATLSKIEKYFASSKGSKYYSISCSAGKTIKEENRIYFNSKEEAEKTGYKLSSSCK